MKITGNEPVNPVTSTPLTIRQHFAAMAMQGILASCDPDNNPFISPIDCAEQSVKCADALMNALNK